MQTIQQKSEQFLRILLAVASKKSVALSKLLLQSLWLHRGMWSCAPQLRKQRRELCGHRPFEAGNATIDMRVVSSYSPSKGTASVRATRVIHVHVKAMVDLPEIVGVA